MCGIIGGVAERNLAPVLLAGLQRLEYRGYDSAGVALLQSDNIERVRCCGKVQALEQALKENPVEGCVGVAHTRWATHGRPSTHNAHPHMSGKKLAIVHNGIIENHEALKKQLCEKGYDFSSQTDTEVIAHCLQDACTQTDNLPAAVRMATQQLQGAYALAVIHADYPDKIVAVRKGSPLVIGVGVNENFVASDVLALLPVTQEFLALEEDELAVISCAGYQLYDKAGHHVERASKQVQVSLQSTEKGGYRHYMQKEIFEQTLAINECLEGRLGDKSVPDSIFGTHASDYFDRTKAVQIIACGTSYHAGRIAQYWLEKYAGIPVNVDIASEFRYREPVLLDGTLVVTISQSGETADTLAALEDINTPQMVGSLCICNVPESSLVRASSMALLTHAGPEIGVASTKAFTTQLSALLLLTAVLGRRNKLSPDDEANLVKDLRSMPERVQKILALDETVKGLVPQFRQAHSALFLGRHQQIAVAMEGALKLKEISYIHAEAYPAGELKHGPLALVDDQMPVVALMPNDALLPKMKANAAEVQARGGNLILIAEDSADLGDTTGCKVIRCPDMPALLAPILMTIPLQLLSYHVAVEKGTDVDQPRNLAKSVTVE